MNIRDYMLQRFRRNNHAKYQKYAEEWADNTTKEQQEYFRQEQKRLELFIQ